MKGNYKYKGKTLEEIADRYGCTKQAVELTVRVTFNKIFTGLRHKGLTADEILHAMSLLFDMPMYEIPHKLDEINKNWLKRNYHHPNKTYDNHGAPIQNNMVE